VNNRQLGSLAANTHTTYYDDDQLYYLVDDPNEKNNIYGQLPEVAEQLKVRMTEYIGRIPGRPFGEFNNYGLPATGKQK